MACRGTIHHKRSGLSGDRSKIIAHHKSVISIVQGAIYILDHMAFFIRTRNRLPIFIPLVIQILALCAGMSGDGLPVKDQTGSLWGQGNLRL